MPTPKSSQQIKIAVPAENKVSKFPSTYRKSSKSTIIDTSTIPTPQSNSRPMSTRHRPSQDNGGMSYREWLKMQAKNAQSSTDKKQMLPIQQLGQMLRSNNIMPANHQ